MATLIAYCVRNGHVEQAILDNIRYLNTHLAPPGLQPREAVISRHKQACLAALNPSPNTEVLQSAVSVGVRSEPGNEWAFPGTDIPDGSFGLLRADEHTLQLVTDPTGSRTIWYLQAEDYFIASTSQRAIVVLARSFQLNPQASAWMLSTGSLGPWHSWDDRIRMVPPNSIVSLNLSSWRLAEDTRQYEYRAEERSEGYFVNELQDRLSDVFATIGNYPPDWVVPLSGGIDSRGIMLWLPDPKRFKYVTWGSEAANGNDKSDAVVAASLARKYGLEHRYVPLQERIGNPEAFFAKFVAAGEGRITNISGYLDEFRFWEALHADNCPGVLRGDQVFGGPPLRRPIQVLELQKLCTLSDMQAPFSSLANHFPDQRVPEELQRRAGETLDEWRCRAELRFRAPVVRAALNDLKYPYTDVVNPLQFRPVLDLVVRMPDRFRTGKKLFARLVVEREPDVPLAANVAIVRASDVIGEKTTHEFLMDGISTLDSDVYLPAELLRHVRALGSSVGRDGRNGTGTSRTSLWQRARNRARFYVGGATITAPQLLLRSYLAIAMSRTLTNDAYALGKIGRDVAIDDAGERAASA